jgi:hypothetical protein
VMEQLRALRAPDPDGDQAMNHIANGGSSTLTLLLTDGSRVELAENEWAEVEQDHQGRFVRVIERGKYVEGISMRHQALTREQIIDGLRSLVNETCHTPLLIAGQFVAVYEHQIALGMRKTIATETEMLLALEHQIRLLQAANTYLRTRLPDPVPTPFANPQREEAARIADLPGLDDLVRNGRLDHDQAIATFGELNFGVAFRFVEAPPGWSTGKLVKVREAPGWAMSEGWDFVLASEISLKDVAVYILDEPFPTPIKA